MQDEMQEEMQDELQYELQNGLQEAKQYDKLLAYNSLKQLHHKAAMEE